MKQILGIRFRDVGKVSYLTYFGKENIIVGDVVVAETKRGVEPGKVLVKFNADSFEKEIQSHEKIIRKATDEDLEFLEKKKEEEKEAIKICNKKIKEHKLKMKLIDAEYMFNKSKIIFYFVSESRIDFRNLVKDLARAFKVRIELRQMGIRDEAKMLGGLGPCGAPLCCATFLNDFQPVSIKMAKDQGVSLNPNKLSGACGRLMCCLKYEQDAYRDIISKMPALGQKVSTPEGNGSVVGHLIIKSQVKVALEESLENAPPKIFKLEEIEAL